MNEDKALAKVNHFLLEEMGIPSEVVAAVAAEVDQDTLMKITERIYDINQEFRKNLQDQLDALQEQEINKHVVFLLKRSVIPHALEILNESKAVV